MTVWASTVGFFYALEADGTRFDQENGPPVRSFDLLGTAVREFRVGTHRVYAVQMGAGTTTTTRNLTALLIKHPFDYLVSVGPIGSISDTISIGSWFRVSEVKPWQAGTWTESGFNPKSGWQIELEDIGTSLNFPPISVASGDAFVSSTMKRGEIAALTNCQAVDMNLLGMKTCLEGRNVTQVHIRVVSDNADEIASSAFQNFRKNYKGKGASLAQSWIKQLPEDETSPENYENLRKVLRGASAPTPPSPPKSAK